MLFEKNNKIFISLPGVPHEMEGLMTEKVIPALKQYFSFSHITHRTLLTAGVGESFIADTIIDFENALPSHIKIAYLPNFGLVRMRLTSSGIDKITLEKELDEIFSQLQELLKEHLVSVQDERMEEVLGKLLNSRKETMCTAESCTGGYIAHIITSHPGSSSFYDGSIISYSYGAKENLLHVNEELLRKKGAVSEEVAREMANGALKNIGSDYAVAVSGIMGPGGGTPDKPVGTVWIAAGNKSRLVTRKFHLRFDRERNIQITAVNALNMLRKFILDNGSCIFYAVAFIYE
jgi:nicotinamide-nucleotide amidase